MLDMRGLNQMQDRRMNKQTYEQTAYKQMDRQFNKYPEDVVDEVRSSVVFHGMQVAANRYPTGNFQILTVEVKLLEHVCFVVVVCKLHLMENTVLGVRYHVKQDKQ